MDVQPVRGNESGRGSRVRNLAIVSLPTIVLVVTVGVGALGPQVARPEPTSPSRPTPSPVSIADGGPRGAVPPSVTSSAMLARTTDAEFPPRALGLPIWSVDAVQALEDAGVIDDRLAAVGGWLTLAPTQASCHEPDGRPSPEPDLCLRQGILADGDQASQIALWFPAGLSLDAVRDQLAAASDKSDTANPVALGRIVVFGGFGAPRSIACPGGEAFCVTGFVVERVVWMDGHWLGRPTVVAAEAGEPVTSEPASVQIAQVTLGNSPTILSGALVGRDQLGTIDPVAAAALAASSASIDGGLWYLRVMPERLGVDIRGRDVRWIVIDADTALVLASHPAVD